MDKTSLGWDPLKEWGDARSVSEDQFAAMAAERKSDPNAYARKPPVFEEYRTPLREDNLMETVDKLRGPGFACLRSKLSGQFGVRLGTTDPAQEFILFQTLDATPESPYVVTIDQFINTPFTGAGQFDLVERDVSDPAVFDLAGVKTSNENAVTFATKSGITDVTAISGWSRIEKEITSDKIYSVVYVPGAGVGSYLISARLLNHIDPIFINPEAT